MARLFKTAITSESTVTGDKVVASNNGNGQNFQVGDDVWLGDINVANTMSLKGQQSATSGYIRFGGDANAFGYDGTKLSYAGNLTTSGLTLSSTTSPIILNASAGTSGQVLTSAGAGATPTWTNASGYTLPTATATALGGIELFSATTQTTAANAVTTTASRTYGLQVNSDLQGVVNVPWTDTVYTLPAATTTALGGIELFDGTVQSTAANAVTTTASRTYGLQLNSDLQGVVNVPWTDTVYTLPAATTTALGGIELFDGTVQSTAANAVTTTASRTYGLQVNASGQGVINVPWTDTDTNTFPTTWTWTAGTTAGPTASITGTSSTISVAAVPVANGTTASGVVTTTTQTFGGAKTFSSAVTAAGLTLSSTTSPIILNASAGTSGFVLTSAGAGATPTWTNPNLVSVNATAKTGAYTLTTSDYGTVVQMNAAAAFTVGTGLYNAPVGTQITLLALVAGVTVVASGASVVVNATPGLKLRAQYSMATLICLSSGASACTWLLTGDLSA